MEPPQPQQKRKHRLVLAVSIGVLIAILLFAVVGASFVPFSDWAFMSARNTYLCAKCGTQICSRWFILGGRRIGRTPAQLSDGFASLNANTCQHELRWLGEAVTIVRLKPAGSAPMRNGRPAGDQFYTQGVVCDAMNSLAATNQYEARAVLDWLWRQRGDGSSLTNQNGGLPVDRLTGLATGDAILLKQQLRAESDRYFGR